MNVLLLSPELFSIGGLQRYDRHLIAALDQYVAKQEGSLSVLCLNDSPPPFPHPELGQLAATQFCFLGRNRFAFIAGFVSRLHDADVIVYGLLGFTLMVALQKLLKPSSHNLLILYGIEVWHRRSRWHAWAANQMEQFISVSQYTLTRFRKAYGILDERPGHVVPNPLSAEWLSQAEAQPLAQVGAPPRLLSVARLSSTEQPKGIDTVIRALPDLLRQFPDLVYVIVGDGPDRARLQALADQLGVRGSVCFRGFVPEEELRQEFARCWLYVMPSAKEGFGFVFIEAMAYGKPVVAARATAIPEVVEHGRTGLLVEPGNAPQLAEAIAELLRDGVLRQQMGAAGRETVRQRYTFDAFCNQVASVLDAWDPMGQR